MLASKINKVRTLALLLVFLGIGVMYIGFLWRSAMPIFLILGMLVMFSSFGLYFWIGMLSTRATQVVCPNCERITKMLGKVDFSMTEKKKRSREFSRSLFVVEDMKAGDIITDKNIRSVRPGFGLHPKYYAEIIGKRVVIDMHKGTPLTFGSIEK